MSNDKRADGEIVFDEMSARQLSEIVRHIARDRGVQAAAVTMSFDEDRGSMRFVVCAPCAVSEADFAMMAGKAIIQEMHRAAERESSAAHKNDEDKAP